MAKQTLGEFLPDANDTAEEVPQTVPVTETSTPPAATMPAWISELLESQKKMQAEIETLRTDNRMFREMAGKNQIMGWTEAQKDRTLKFGYLKRWNEKIIVGYKKLDLSKRNPYAKDAVGENVFIPLIYRDGTEESINYSDFTNIKDLVKIKILKNDGEFATVQFEDETQITIESKFLNP